MATTNPNPTNPQISTHPVPNTPSKSAVVPYSQPQEKENNNRSNDTPMTDKPPLPTDVISTANNLIITHSGFKCTAPPPEGFPSPQLGEAITKDVTQQCINDWDQKPGGKLWVRVFKASPRKTQVERIIITNILAIALGKDRSSIDLQLTSPISISETEAGSSNTRPQGPGSRASESGPIHILLHSLSNAELNFLANTKVIAAENQTLFFLPYHQPIPTYIMSLGGITALPSPTVNSQIVDSIIKAINSNKERTEKVGSIVLKLGEDAVEKFASSIKITSFEIIDRSTQIPLPVWNIYSTMIKDLPSFQDYLTISHELRKIPTYTTRDFGIGSPRIGASQPFCAKCKSQDHLSLDCPFPKLPGWLGPRDEANDQSTREMDERINKRGGFRSRPYPSRGNRKTRRGRFHD